MKKKILSACFGALFLFGVSFVFSIENSEAASNIAEADKELKIDCKGSDGHCMEYKGTTYYGKAYATDA